MHENQCGSAAVSGDSEWSRDRYSVCIPKTDREREGGRERREREGERERGRLGSWRSREPPGVLRWARK